MKISAYEGQGWLWKVFLRIRAWFGRGFRNGRDPEGALTVIGPDSYLEGTLRSTNPIRIQGKVEGPIHARDLKVEEGGQVQGEVKAETVSVAGKIVGDVVASRVLHLERPGQLLGDIKTTALVVEAGAAFEGHCVMDSEKRKDQVVGPLPAVSYS